MKETTVHTLLIADDEKSSGMALGRLLRMAGYSFILKEDARSALDEIREPASPISLVIACHHLPGINGTALLESVKNISPDTIRFLLADDWDMNTVTDAVNRGGVHKCITRPWNTNAILEAVSQGLRQYEKGLERSRLLEAVKQQNRKLYSLDQKLVDLTRGCREELNDINRRIGELEILLKKGDMEANSLESVIEKLDLFLTDASSGPLEAADQIYSDCLMRIYTDFQELSLRRGFEFEELQEGKTE